MRFKKLTEGMVKYKRRFAFFPEIIEGEKIWLEFYYLKCETYWSELYKCYRWTQSDWCPKILKESLPSKLEKSLK